MAILPALTLLAGTVAGQAPKPRVPSKLTIDELIQIKHPSGFQWTPDGSHVWFTYDDGGVNNVWVAPSDGAGRPVALTTYTDGQSGAGGFWSKDGKTFFFPREGGLLAVPVTGGTPHVAWPSAAHARGFALSPDGTRIAFVTGESGRGGANSASGGDLIVHTFATNADLTIAHSDSALGAPSWSPDGASLTYTVGGGGGGPIQHYSSPPEIGPKLIFVATEGGRGGGGGTTFTVSATGGTPTQVAGGGRGGRGGGGGRGGAASIDATHMLSTRVSNNGTVRTTESVDVNGGAPTVLHVDTASKFFSSVNTTANAVSPDHRWLLYTSDITGWDQIYVVPTTGGTPVQLTKSPGTRTPWPNRARVTSRSRRSATIPPTRRSSR